MSAPPAGAGRRRCFRREPFSLSPPERDTPAARFTLNASRHCYARLSTLNGDSATFRRLQNDIGFTSHFYVQREEAATDVERLSLQPTPNKAFDAPPLKSPATLSLRRAESPRLRPSFHSCLYTQHCAAPHDASRQILLELRYFLCQRERREMADATMPPFARPPPAFAAAAEFHAAATPAAADVFLRMLFSIFR